MIFNLFCGEHADPLESVSEKAALSNFLLSLVLGSVMIP